MKHIANTSEHTPTPWDIEHMDLSHGLRITQDNGTVARFDGDGPRELANAAFIVRAVNAHDEFVDLLKDSSFMLQHQCADIGSKECVGCNQQMKIKQAIAKAEGK